VTVANKAACQLAANITQTNKANFRHDFAAVRRRFKGNLMGRLGTDRASPQLNIFPALQNFFGKIPRLMANVYPFCA
jgi:hypothetical protein